MNQQNVHLYSRTPPSNRTEQTTDTPDRKTAYIMVPFIGYPRGKKREGTKLSGQKTDQLSPESGGEEDIE